MARGAQWKGLVLTAWIPFFQLFLVPAPAVVDQADAPAMAAQALADAERVVAVHAIPGAVVFDLDRAGELFQLTVSLDDDGAVTASAIGWRGAVVDDGGGAAPVVMDRVARIDVAEDGALVLSDGAEVARVEVSGD